MKVVIIEDEPLTARDLAACILAAEPAAEVVAMLSSVEEAIGFFRGMRRLTLSLVISNWGMG